MALHIGTMTLTYDHMTILETDVSFISLRSFDFDMYL